MKSFIMFIALTLLLFTGCDSSDSHSQPLSTQKPILYSTYEAASVRIVGLTEYKPIDNNIEGALLDIYVDLLDSFASQIKAPGIFRFELYEYVPRSSDPRGTRLSIWPDIDLTDAVLNNEYWQDHLRSYHFQMKTDFTPAVGKSFVLEVTCTTPAAKRLVDTFHITCRGN